jgi:peptide/nickel transport system substrate-binding protein
VIEVPGIKRRTLVIVVAMFALVVSACVGSTPAVVKESNAEPSSAVAEGETCRCGISVAVGANGDGKIVNPILPVDIAGLWRSWLITDNLVDLDPVTLEPVPRLAKSWEVSEDGTTYTFHLVDADVRWHDGEPFTVDDIEFTLMEILKPTYTGPFQERFKDLVGADKVIAGEATSLEGFKIIDDKTVQFKLNKPNAAFLAMGVYYLRFIPRHLLEGKEITEDMPFSQAPVGTGPYKFKEWVKGSRFVMERNPDYWGEQPCVETLTQRVIPDMQAIAAAVETGDLDATNRVPPPDVPRLAETEGLTVYSPPAVGPEMLWFNMQHPILQDLRVRQAIGHAIDVEAFVKNVLKGTTERANSFVSPASWAYDPDVDLPQYDPDRAKQLLAEAGYPDGFEITLSTNAGNFFREQYVEFAQAELAKIGIDVKIEKQQWGTFIGNVMQENYELRFMNAEGGVGIPDPDTIATVFHTDGSGNYSYYSNPEVDRLLEEARSIFDVEERKALYHQAIALLHEDLPAVAAFWRPEPLVAQSKYKNVTPTVFGQRYGHVHEWCLEE